MAELLGVGRERVVTKASFIIRKERFYTKKKLIISCYHSSLWRHICIFFHIVRMLMFAVVQLP